MPSARRTRPRRFLAASVLASMLLALVAAPAGAHSRTGTLDLVSIVPSTDGSVVVTVEFNFDGDGHPVLDGVVQLGGDSSQGVTLMPVTFSATEVPGRLVAAASMPGPATWDLRITSTDPVAELTATYDPSDPAGAASSAQGGELSGTAGAQLPVVWIALGCAGVAAVFAMLRRRSRVIGSDASEAWDR